MPARRKPAHVLEAAGAFKKNPQRKRADACLLAHGSIGDPPGYFSEQESVIWHEVVEAAPDETLAAADRFVLETLCRAMALLRSLPIDQLKPTLIAQVNAGLARLGLSPTDRARVQPLVKPDDDHGWSQLA